MSLRAEVRFTRDVDVAIDLGDDPAVEALARELRGRAYDVIALVMHVEAVRIATVRLRSPSGITVDLLAARSGIEAEIVARATPITIEGIGTISVAGVEDLLAMKILSMDARRPQDRIDAIRLVEVNPTLDELRLQDSLRLIKERGFHRNQDLAAKLRDVVENSRTA